MCQNIYLINSMKLTILLLCKRKKKVKKEITSNIKMDDVIEIFLKLPIDKQEEIESEI